MLVGVKYKKSSTAMVVFASLLFLSSAHNARAQDFPEGSAPVVKPEVSVEFPEADVLLLPAAIEAALSNNPGLKEIGQRAEAAAAVPSQVGSLPDPVLKFLAANLPADNFDRKQENMSQMGIGISQAFPFPGKLRLKKEAAQFIATATVHDHSQARLNLVRDIKIEWWRLFYLDQALEVVSRNLDLMRGFVEIAGKKYEVGSGLQSDIILAQLELSKLLEFEIRVKNARHASEARLVALIALPIDHVIRLPKTTSESLGDIPGEQKLLFLAENNSPLLSAQERRVDAAGKRKDLAKRDFYPDFVLSANYGARSGTNPVSDLEREDVVTFWLDVKIPLYAGTKQSKALEQRRAQENEEEFGLAQTRLMIQKEISTRFAFYQQNREQVSLFSSGIIPQAQQTVDAMRAGYLVDEVDFLNLVSAQITLYNYETRYWQVFAEAEQALAAIEATVGEEISNEAQ